MRHLKFLNGGILLFYVLFGLCFLSFAGDHPLQYFLSKAASKDHELNNKERDELLDRIDETIKDAQRVHSKLTQAIQTGEVPIQYQEGKFWISRLEEDKGTIEMAAQQIRLLREKPVDLVSSVNLYKSLRDISSNFSAYNNMPCFSGWVGDLAPDLELWADPVFFKLYLLPLALLKDKNKDKEVTPPQKEKKTNPKSKKR